jgi:predicted ester cyclase
MSQTNLDLALRWMHDVWNTRTESTIDEVLAEDAVGHAESRPDIRGVSEFRAYRAALLDAFPDLRIEVQHGICDGDDVALRWRIRGSHGGNGLGIAPTNKPVDFWGITWFRFSDGRLVEGWDAWNEGGLMQRLQAA